MIWQPIETAPKDGTPILVYCPDARKPHESITAARYIPYTPTWGYWEPCVADHESERWPRLKDQPTHWMKLPAPPRPASRQESEQHMIRCPTPAIDRGVAAAAAAVLFPGSHFARAGFNAGAAWALTQLKSDHPEAWELLERAWKERQP
jgi:hypothetical protein